MKKITAYLLLVGFALCLSYIWLPHFFVTGDGPCHLYNAQVLHDLWVGKNVAFYDRFYTLAYQPNPNWLSTFVLAILLFAVNGVLAEKIFLSCYVILYIVGFYLLIKKIRPNATYLPLLVLLFVFPHTMSKGFYNFSFSVAFYFWVVWSWLRFLDKRNIGNALLFFLFMLLIFFTHLLAFGFAAFTCAALVVSYAVANGQAERGHSGFFLKNILWLCLMLAPFVILMQWFTQKEGGLQLQLSPHLYRLVELAQYKYLVNVTHTEVPFAFIAGIAVLLLFLVSMLRFGSRPVINKYDGFLLSFLFVLFVYLFFPEDFLGRLILITMRVQIFVFIIMACCVAYMLPPGKLEGTGSLILFMCFVGLSIFRISCLLSASDGVADYVSGIDNIKPYSVVLPLDFSPGGKDRHGKPIGDRNWLFTHAAEYMSTEKPLIFLDNYEANMGYFPISWNKGVNPYNYLSKYEGIEGQPPYADIDEYQRTTGVIIDYILMWCYDPRFLQSEHFSAFYHQVNSEYHMVYTSPNNRTILLERNQLAGR